MADELISIKQAVELGITKLRKPEWVDSNDHIEITIVQVDGKPHQGPWVKLWSSTNAIVGNPNPFLIMIIELDIDKPLYHPYSEG